MSHMELLCEGARPEPRLLRLLGHCSTYENTSRWWQENNKKNVFYTADEKEEARESGVSTKRPTDMQSVRDLSEYQTTIQSQLQYPQLPTVTVIEYSVDSDESDESDDDDNGSITSDDESLVLERIESSMEAFSLRDDGNHASDLSRCRSAKAGARR